MLVHKLRLQRGWSQEQLAELSGLSVRTVQRIERGQGASIESLKALAAVFEVDFQQLRPETDVTQPPLPTDPAAAPLATPPAASMPSAPHAAAMPSASASAPSPASRLSPDEVLALRQVRRIRRFYVHLAQYLVVVTVLGVVNVLFSPKVPWALFVAGGWGLGVLAHGLRAFDRTPFLGPKWERAQVERRLRRPL